MGLKLLVNPMVRGATFADAIDVARAELAACAPPCSVRVEPHATLTLLDVDLEPEHAAALSRLSFVQAVFRPVGEGLEIIEAAPDYRLPEALVWGDKYRGKTNELVTQLALNVALHTCELGAADTRRLLDPMAGRGTTLWWAARHGLSAWGIEQDPRALEHVQRHLKRTTKQHRIRHRLRHGSAGRRRKDAGRTLEVEFDSSTVQLVHGDSRDAPTLVGRDRYHLVVTDVPYGIQHVGPRGTRNPLTLLAACAPAWAECTKRGGVLAMVFNRLHPKREDLMHAFSPHGWITLPFEAPHRVSESILRDVLVFRRG